MENNFNNEEMMNNGVEAMDSGVNYKSISNGQAVATILVCSVICAGVYAGIGWFIKRIQAKKQVEVIDNVENGDIETTEE